MGATVWEAALLPLKDDEGKLVLLVQQWEKPTESDCFSFRLSSEPTIYHGGPGEPHLFCGGHIRFITISESKKVLHCERCGLRIAFPSVETVGELAEYLASI